VTCEATSDQQAAAEAAHERPPHIHTPTLLAHTRHPPTPPRPQHTHPRPHPIPRIDVHSKDARPPIVCSQGPPPPNPLVVERFQSVVSQLFQQRIVRMGGPVDDDMANLIVAQLLFLDSVDQERDITMYVNSPGGSVTAGRSPGGGGGGMGDGGLMWFARQWLLAR